MVEWFQLNFSGLLSAYSILGFPFVLYLLLSWLPLPRWWFGGRWFRW